MCFYVPRQYTGQYRRLGGTEGVEPGDGICWRELGCRISRGIEVKDGVVEMMEKKRREEQKESSQKSSQLSSVVAIVAVNLPPNRDEP